MPWHVFVDNFGGCKILSMKSPLPKPLPKYYSLPLPLACWPNFSYSNILYTLSKMKCMFQSKRRPKGETSQFFSIGHNGEVDFERLGCSETQIITCKDYIAISWTTDNQLLSDSEGSTGFFYWGILRYFTQTGGITPLGVFSDAFPGHKMRVHLLTAPSVKPVWGSPIQVLTGPNVAWLRWSNGYRASRRSFVVLTNCLF